MPLIKKKPCECYGIRKFSQMVKIDDDGRWTRVRLEKHLRWKKGIYFVKGERKGGGS